MIITLIIPIGEDGKLSTAEKKRILNNNIFGVDLDERAVEIAKLSLLLKVLEDETNETLKDEKLLGFKEKVLPNLDMNIKCGNSLIGSDFKKVTPSVSKAEIEEIKPFDWQVMFPQVFKQGGFDCVIGNPPYGALFNEQSKKYLRSKFETFMGRGESYVVFIEKILSLLNNNGLLGCIIPDTYLNLEFTRPIRNLLLCSTKLKEVVVLPSTIFADATVDTTILITEKAKRIESFYKTDVTIKVFQKKEFLINLHNPLKEFETSTQKWFETNSFNVSSNGIDLDLIQKIDNNFPKLDTIAEMFSGIKAYEVGKGSPPQTAKIRDEKPFTSEKQKSAKWLPSYDGKHIGRYEIFWKSNNWIHYGQWLAAPRNSQNFENEKILIRKIIGKTLIATYVEETSYCNTLLFILKLKKDIKIDYEFVLGVLNSTFIGWYFRKKFQIAKEDTFPQIMIRDILQFAFPTKSSKKLNDKLVSLVKEMIQLKVDIAKATSSKIIDKLETEFKYKDDSINNLVYELYGLTKEEIEVIEND